MAGAAVPPSRLRITIHRVHTDLYWAFSGFSGSSTPDQEPYASYVRSGIVDQDMARKISGGGECHLRTGSFVQYDLPFQLKIRGFSFGISSCCAERFKDWTFEAFDGENWRQLLNFARPMSPTIRFGFWRFGAGGQFASNRFRIRLAESNEPSRCMHIRGLELFGTILPPWRLD